MAALSMVLRPTVSTPVESGVRERYLPFTDSSLDCMAQMKVARGTTDEMDDADAVTETEGREAVPEVEATEAEPESDGMVAEFDTDGTEAVLESEAADASLEREPAAEVESEAEGDDACEGV